MHQHNKFQGCSTWYKVMEDTGSEHEDVIYEDEILEVISLSDEDDQHTVEGHV